MKRFRLDESHIGGQQTDGGRDFEAEAREILRQMDPRFYYIVVDFSQKLEGAEFDEISADSAVGGYAEIGDRANPNTDAVALVSQFLMETT